MNRTFSDFDKCLTDTKSKSNSELQRSLRGLNFGRLYLKNGDLDTALKYVNSYLAVKPNSSDGHKLLAQVYEALGDDQKAVLNYRKALDLKKGVSDSFVVHNNSPVMTSMSNSQMPETNSLPSRSPNPNESTAVKRDESPPKVEIKSEPCAVCTSNQTVLKKVVEQNDELMESNKVILDLLRQNCANISDIQNQLVALNDSISNLSESQNTLKDTLFDFMAQEENQGFDEYLLDDKENVSLDANELLSTNQSNQWQSPAPQLSNLDATKPLSELFKPAADSWKCSDCYVQNKSQDTYCLACSAIKPGMVAQSGPPQPNSSFSFQLPSAQSISFNPQLTSSSVGFKFGLNTSPNLKPVSNSIFSNTSFKFGNAISPQAFPSFGSPFAQLGSHSEDQNESKPNENTNIFPKSGDNAVNNLTENKNLNTFSFSSDPTFNFQFSKPQTEVLKSPKSSEDTSFRDTLVKDSELNNSFSEVEPSNADSIYFQPVVPLPPKIDVKTGEEDEIVLHQCRSRLFRFSDNEWKERGVGDLKILKARDSNRIRLLMRRDTIFKVCLNQYITKDMKLELKEDKKSITWSAIDYSDDTPTPQIFLLRLKNPENAQLFLQAFESAQNSLEETVGDQSVNTAQPDTQSLPTPLTDSNAIQTTKPSEGEDIEIIFEKVPQSQEILEKVRNLKLPLNFFDYENQKPCPGCRGCPEKEDQFFSSSKPNTPEVTIETCDRPEESLFQSAIVATNVTQSEWNNTSGQKLWLSNTPAPLFSSDKDPDDDTAPENPDIYFKPLIPLPDLVEVKTGEEDETVVYCQRAKLFRFEPQTKEWKERGIGDFKILKHKSKNRYRMVLRRDQILKIACNHYITPDMGLNPMSTSETAICWYAIDYTDGTPVEEQFALKFKNKEILSKFKDVFNDCKSKLIDNEADNGPEETN